MKTNPTRKSAGLNKYEKALILLAEYMEDPMHDQYRIKAQVLDMLGLEFVPKPKKVVK